MAGVDTAADLISWDKTYQRIAELQRRAARIREINQLLREDHPKLSVEERQLLIGEFQALELCAEQDRVELVELQRKVSPEWFHR